ncbi:hypothetical protein FSARC_4221 [Fusarium sarcochroum]|uniref:RING-type domain-containing protein n=1 Tax=Fusarium sarcochroum TaxID=1208366 RepID=A0A8H4U2R5_9HYPO|nr:hypothetical protein FSARC_4221 [Fusarium sarcochroum]
MSIRPKTMLSIDSLLNPEPLPARPMITSTYWPVLRDYLLGNPDIYETLHLECGICLDKMTVFPHEHSYDPEMHHFSHRARILPCGHMFGSKCAHAMIDEALSNDLPICCPICRTDFSLHRDCGHVHTGMPMPTNVEAIKKFPPTLSEGGVVADKCGDCQVTEIILGINYLAPTLLSSIELEEREVLCVAARTLTSCWGLQPECDDGMENYLVQNVPLGRSLQRICNEIKQRLKESSSKTWKSMDLAGFELSIQLYDQIQV